MAKLADALASGASDRKVMGVQVPLRAQVMVQFSFGRFVTREGKDARDACNIIRLPALRALK